MKFTPLLCLVFALVFITVFAADSKLYISPYHTKKPKFLWWSDSPSGVAIGRRGPHVKRQPLNEVASSLYGSVSTRAVSLSDHINEEPRKYGRARAAGKYQRGPAVNKPELIAAKPYQRNRFSSDKLISPGLF